MLRAGGIIKSGEVIRERFKRERKRNIEGEEGSGSDPGDVGKREKKERPKKRTRRPREGNSGASSLSLTQKILRKRDHSVSITREGRGRKG